VFDQLFTGMILGKEPRATIDAVKMGRKKMFASSAKAEYELGYKVLPVEDALRRAVEWFQTNGYVETSGQPEPVSA
jgi:dihydroflavonol-4-reductase